MMELYLYLIRALEHPPLLYLAELFFKGFVILSLVALCAWSLRKASAATRHLIWLGGLGALLLLPLTVRLVPNVPLPAIALDTPSEVSAGVVASSSTVSEAAVSPRTAEYETSVVYATTEPAARGQPEKRVSLWLLAIPAIWIGGGLLTLLPLAGAWWRLGRLVRRGWQPASPEWQTLLRECRESLGIKRNIRLLEGPAGTMPMAWGIRQPVVLLPAEAEVWPESRRRAVLLHELAHVKRRDCLSQLVARVACAVHWFNPLAWFAYRRLLATRERACDDLVLLAGGVRPSEYAKHLLGIARAFRTAFPLGQAAMPMARNSALEGRVRAILNEVPRTGSAGRKSMLVAVFTSLTVAVGAGSIGPEAAAGDGSPAEANVAGDSGNYRENDAMDETSSRGRIISREYNERAYNAAQPVQKFEMGYWTSDDESGERVEKSVSVFTTAMDEGFFRSESVEGLAHRQYGMRVGPELLQWSMQIFNPPHTRTGYAYMNAVNGEPLWEFAPYEGDGNLLSISRNDPPMEFIGIGDPRAPEVFGERLGQRNHTVIVSEGDILFARLITDPDTVYAIRFAEQGSSGYLLRDENRSDSLLQGAEFDRNHFGRLGIIRVEYIVFSPEGTDPGRSVPEASSVPTPIPVGTNDEETSRESALNVVPTSNPGDTEAISGKDGVPPLPQVFLALAILEVTDSSGFMDDLASHGFDLETGEAIASTESHQRFPEGRSNGISHQITGTRSGGFSRERLIEIAERPGIEILSLPSVSTVPGREAMIWIGGGRDVFQDDGGELDPGILARMVPAIAEDEETLRLELLMSVIGSNSDQDANRDFRQVKLDDFGIRDGSTAVVGGITQGVPDLDRAMFVFVTPEIQWP